MFTHLRPAIALTLFFAALTGIAYPLAITGAAQAMFPHQASGSPVVRADGTLLGSALIGQLFERDSYFHGRPSAVNYDAATSSGTNLGPSSKALLDSLAERAAAYPDGVPADLVTASGSGLDPDISPAGALAQMPRIAASRGLDEAALRQLIAANVRGPDLGILGQPRVNVLALNLALDALKP
ncbi:MAG: potassium-transporting ATPase subunit KdpC [Hyphomicrobiales bacterium]|nr:MAG: potassium-transporting ATPase subunit KdpC [Hyphomicrobiales bacterium]